MRLMSANETNKVKYSLDFASLKTLCKEFKMSIQCSSFLTLFPILTEEFVSQNTYLLFAL